MVTATTTTSGVDTAGADLAIVLHRLRDNREAIAWSERRGLVGRIAPPLSEGEALEPFRSLMILLAEDPKWEVRLEVARAVGNTVDGDFAQLAHRLAEDSHSYVQRAARRSIQQRRRAAREAQKKKRGIDLVLALYEELEEKHGKQAAARARRLAEQLYDVLVGATVHEMQSVLTVLKADGISLAERERQGSLEPTVLRRKLGKITERTGFLERLLRDMRNYARPVPNERTPVKIADLVGEARSIVMENLLARGVNPHRVVLTISVPPQLELNVSRVHMVSALVNLLKNAYEALPAKPAGLEGAVIVQAASRGKQVTIAVTDSGVGIPTADLEEVRQCLPGRTGKKNQGTGFGLCSARRFVEAHGGRLKIDSQENVGTTVTLSLPL